MIAKELWGIVGRNSCQRFLHSSAIKTDLWRSDWSNNFWCTMTAMTTTNSRQQSTMTTATVQLKKPRWTMADKSKSITVLPSESDSISMRVRNVGNSITARHIESSGISIVGTAVRAFLWSVQLQKNCREVVALTVSNTMRWQWPLWQNGDSDHYGKLVTGQQSTTCDSKQLQ